AAARHADRDRPSLQRVAAGRVHGRRPTPRPGCGRRGGRAAGAGAHRQGAAHARRRQAAARDAGVRQPCRLRRAACSMTLLRSSLFALALIIVTPPYAVLALATFPLPRLLRYRIISGWSRLVVLLARVILGIRWRVEGREHLPDQPAVILAKHQSAWETMAFQVLFPPQVLVLKRELLWIPFFGWGLALMSPIAIDRSRGAAALRSIARRGRERLEQGFWVVVFPEGTRVRPGERREYHVGGAWLAVAAPLRMPWREIEAFLRRKERWIVAKLDEWSRAPRPSMLHGESGEWLPLFGKAVVLDVNEGARAVQWHQDQLIVHAPRPRV